MTSWERAIDLVLGYEGGYVNNPDDPGGETKYGISKRSYPNEDIKNLTVERAKEIYYRDYWKPVLGDQIPENLGIAVFDCAVNQGVKTAIRLLQINLDLVADGTFGPKTLAAAKKATDFDVWMYLLERARKYMQTNNVDKFGKGWGTRLIILGQDLFRGKTGLL